MKIAIYVAGALLLSCAAVSNAQRAFDGTWKIDRSKTKVENVKPFSIYLAQGWYHCDTCTPSLAVKADGTDQPVSDPRYDSLSVKEIDAKSVSFVGKKNHKVVFESSDTVSADGKTLTEKGTEYASNANTPANWLAISKRAGIAPSGVHAISGQWLEVSSPSDAAVMLTSFKTAGDELTLTRPTGETYTAKFDGNDYPAKGASHWYDTVSLKRLGQRSFEETEKLKGKAVETDTWTVSNDGKTLTFVIFIMSSKSKTTYVATKVGEQLAMK